MNVAIFTDNDFDKVNGVTTTLSAAVAHAPQGMRLRIYTAGKRAVDAAHYLSLQSVGVPIPFYGEMAMYVPRVRAYVEHARADRIDVVHLTTPGPIGLAAMYVAARLRLPMVGSFHTDLAAYTTLLSGSADLGVLMREYMRWPYGKCWRVLVPSEHTRQLLIGAQGQADRIEIWPRGVDTVLFTPAKRSARLRDEWEVSDRRPAIVYVGRVSREKGLRLLPRIGASLCALGIDHRFIIVGQGPMLDELRQRLPDAVFTGVLSREGVAEALASSDLFVFPSRTDTAGNVVLEAQASGVPVLVTDSGGPSENMVAGATGAVRSDDDPMCWAYAIAELLRGGRLAQMAESARAYALTRRWDMALEPLYRAYRDACAIPAAAARQGALPLAATGKRL
jgi:glycosyltransferase involved in cell wall biosynthesis